MRREGPCFHCGIKSTPLWRHGPADKPVLCNACGSRWRLQRSLKNYTPKHAIERTSPPKMGSIIGSHKSKVSNRPIPKGKRSLRLRPLEILSPMERFQWQMYCLSQEPQFKKMHEEQEEDILIYHKSSNHIPNEIGLGAVIFK